MHLFGYLYEEYHDARSLEHKERSFCLLTQLLADWSDYYAVPFYEFRITALILSDLCRRKFRLSTSSAVRCLQDTMKSSA